MYEPDQQEQPSAATGGTIAIIAPPERASELRHLLDGRQRLVGWQGTASSPGCLLVVHEPPAFDALAHLASLTGRTGAARTAAVVVVATRCDPTLRRALLRAGAMEVVSWDQLDADGLAVAIGDAHERLAAVAQRVERRQRKLVQILEHSTELVATAELDGRLAWINPAGRKLAGLSADDDPRRFTCGDLVPEAWQPYFHDVIIKEVRSRGLWSGEMQIRNVSTGEVRDVDRSIFLLRDPDTGEPWCFGTVTRDITEQKAAATALAQASEQLRAALTATDVGLWHWDPQRDDVRGDDNFLHLFGFPLEPGGVRRVAQFIDRIHSDDRARIEAAIADAVEKSLLYDEVFRVVRPDGSVRWVHARGLVNRDERGVAVSFPGIVLDVTAQHEATDRLRESDERYRTLLDSIDEGYCIIEVLFDEDGRAVDYRFLEHNPSFARQSGLVGAIGKRAREMLPDLEPFWIETYGHVALTGETARIAGFERGTRRWFEVQALRVGDPAQRRVAVLFRDVTARHATDEALRESEARFRRVFDTNLLGICYWDLNGVVDHANDEYLRIVGYDRADLEAGAVNWRAMTPPDHRAQDERLADELRRGEKPAPVEKELIRKDGKRVWVLLGLASTGGTKGVGFAADISRQKETEARLRDSELRARNTAARVESERAILDAILDAAPAGIVLVDAEGKVVRMNAANELLWGKAPPSEVKTATSCAWRGWWAERSERRGRRVKPDEWAIARALRGETVRDDVVEIEPFDRPGTRRTVLNSGAPVRDGEGRITGAIVAQMDISALVAAEAAQRESEARFRALADNIAQLAWMTDEAGAIVWFNRRWFEYTGTELEQAKGWGWRAVIHPDHVERVVEKLRHHLASGEPWEDTFQMRSASGEYRWFLTRAIPIHDDEGRVVRWFGTSTDVTVQREAEDTLREADRRKDDFIAILAHELRNPLAPLRLAVQLLRRAGVTEPRLARAQDVIDRQVTHMARLIDDLLDVSRITRGKLALQREACDLVAIARQTAEDYRASIEDAGLTLVLAQPSEPVWVNGDPVRLAQMIGNLLHNAGRFTEKGGRVEVRTSLDGASGFALVAVSDTGVGIDPALLPRIFDPFSQADQDLARSKGGLGLGLALTKGLAELHGGGVSVESEGLGRGATFTLRIPLSTARATGTALRVLVVEDNRDAAETLGELLELSGHEVALAFDGATAIEKARSFHPQVVISDLGLPGEVDGYAVARRLRADPALDGIHLIALSGYATDEARRRALDAGFDAHIAKPPDVATLERTLTTLTRH